jgi:hypothetical protein
LKTKFWKYDRGSFRSFDFDKAVSFLNEDYQTLIEIDKHTAKQKMSMLIMKFLDETIITMNDALAIIIQLNLFNDKLKDRYLTEEETINLYDSIIDVVRSEMYYKIIESFEDISLNAVGS